MARLYWSATDLTRSTTTATTAQTKLTLTFTPNASQTYVICASCLVDTTNAGTFLNIELTDGTTLTPRKYKLETGEASGTNKAAVRLIQTFTAPSTPASKTWTMQYYLAATGPTMGISEARIVALELGANDLTAAATAATTTTLSAAQTKTSVTLAAGQYLLIAGCGIGISAGTPQVAGAVVQGKAGTTVFGAMNPWRQVASATTAWALPWQSEFLYTAAASDVFALQFNSDGTATAQCQAAYVVALKVSDLPLLSSGEARTEGSTTGATDVDAASLTFTALAGDYLVIDTAQVAGSNSSTAATHSNHLEIDGVNDTDDVRTWASGQVKGYMTRGNWRIATLAAGSRTYKNQYNSSNATLTAYMKEAGVYAIQLLDTPRRPQLLAPSAVAGWAGPTTFGV